MRNQILAKDNVHDSTARKSLKGQYREVDTLSLSGQDDSFDPQRLQKNKTYLTQADDDDSKQEISLKSIHDWIWWSASRSSVTAPMVFTQSNLQAHSNLILHA